MEKEKVWVVREVANTANNAVNGTATYVYDTFEEAVEFILNRYNALFPLVVYAGWGVTTSRNERNELTSLYLKSADELYEISTKMYECELKDKTYYVYAKEIDAFLGKDGKLTPFTSEAMCYDNADTAEDAAQKTTDSTGNVFRVVCD